LAEKGLTTQAVVSRLENVSVRCSLETVVRLAKALDAVVELHLIPSEDLASKESHPYEEGLCEEKNGPSPIVVYFGQKKEPCADVMWQNFYSSIDLVSHRKQKQTGVCLMKVDDLIKDPNSMDVSPFEIHNLVQCVDVHLLTSTFNPLENQVDDTMGLRLIFKIEGTVDGQTAFSRLHVQVFIFNPEDTKLNPSYRLRFTLLGIFVSMEKIQPKALVNFIRLYTLFVLWPYAREVTSDQLRRAGLPFDSLPIINPQVVTKRLIDGKLVKVKILAEAKKEPSEQTSEFAESAFFRTHGN
jgi:preprotein translocase subunit SecB